MREMKDSGVEWIGLIPENWSIYKNKEVLNLLYSGGTPSSGSADYYSDEGTPFITIADMSQSEYVDSTKNALTHNGVVSKGLKILPVGTILYSIYATIGAVSETRINATINQAILALVPKEFLCIKQYYKYNLIAMKDYVLSDTSKNTQANLNADKVKNFKIILPPVIEQRLIADFLDAKCAEIDALRADIEKEIEILEEYKKSIVFDAVCKGIKESNYKTTDSDVWQIIPKDWNLVDIKYLFEITKRIAGKEGFEVIAITQQGLKYKDLSSNEGQLASDYSGYQFVYPGDYAMNHMDLLTGWVDLSDKFGVTSPDYRVFRLRNPQENDRLYYKYIMQCCYMNRIFYSLGQGVSNLGRWRLQTSAFNNFKVPVPPYKEQISIGRYLDDALKNLNEAIESKKDQIVTLDTYKKSIIYEYDTGKKEVV